MSMSVCLSVCLRRGWMSYVPWAVSWRFHVYQYARFIHLSVSVTHDFWPQRPRLCRQVYTFILVIHSFIVVIIR